MNLNFRQEQARAKVKGLIFKHQEDVGDFNLDVS